MHFMQEPENYYNVTQLKNTPRPRKVYTLRIGFRGIFVCAIKKNWIDFRW